MTANWSVEQVEALATSAAAITAARPLATPSRWSGLGADDRIVWGAFQGGGAEPYDTMVDHVAVAVSCSCPSRRTPCKHALALLLMWVHGDVADSSPPTRVARWLAGRAARRPDPATATTADADVSGDHAPAAHRSRHDGGMDAGPGAAPSSPTESPIPDEPPTEQPDEQQDEPVPDRDTARDERVERMHAGLDELDRWLDDRIRTGLADPSLARYATWDQLAARLVDAQAGSLANRIRRLAGAVGASPHWHHDVLAELGLLHLLAQAGRRLGSLPEPLADAVATTVGWQVRRADVLAGVPDTDRWVVAGRSDTREDRIEVRRHWLRGEASGRWALVLSFAAFQQSLDTSLQVGTSVHADLHRYPGPALRALVGDRHGEPVDAQVPPSAGVVGACAEIGTMLAAEPWLDRVPVTVRAAPTRVDADRWALTDDDGSLPLLPGADLASVLAVSAGADVDLTCEWTPHGLVPLTVHLPERSIDVGPRADASFVSAA